MTSGLKMICLIRIYTSYTIKRFGAGVGSNGVRLKASNSQQSTREIFLSKCNNVLLETQDKYLKTFTRLDILVYSFKYIHLFHREAIHHHTKAHPK